MQIYMTARKTTITNGMKTAIESKLAFLNKFLNEESVINVTAEVMTEKEQKISVLFNHEGSVFKAHSVKENIYYGLDEVADKIKKQISKHKELKKTKRHSTPEITPEKSMDSEANKGPIIKRKYFTMKPMSELEAIEEMEMLGHPSFMFINADVNFLTCLLYKRKDNKYGLIEGILMEEAD